MSTASPSVSTTTAATAAAASAAASPYGGISSMHAAPQQPAPPAPQPQAPTASHSGAPALHGHASTALACSDPHVGGHASSAGLYQQQPDSVNQSSHHMASSFPSTQLSPMTSPYAATYAAAQHPMYSASYPGHAYAPYPNYFGHISHYGTHPPHYPAAATSGPAYHAPFMSSMMPHAGYNPHTPAHIPSHHAPSAAAMPLSMTTSSANATSPAAPGGMTSGAMMAASSYGSAPQYTTPVPWMGRHRVTTTLWEDEGTLCFQVDVKGVCVARRHDNNMVNGTKLLNVCGMSRGKRDGILKNEKERIVVKVGAMHLKGVWIAFNRAKQLAEQHGIIDILYPLFEPNIQSFLYHPDNYPRTAAVMAAAQERQVHRHYGGMPANGVNTPVKDVSSSDISAASLPLHSSLPHSHWGSPGQTTAHDTSATSNSADTSLSYSYPQHHSHYHHPATVLPTAHAACQQTPNSTAASVTSPTPAPTTPGMFHSPNTPYSAHAAAMPPPTVRSTTAPAAPGMMVDRRLEHAATPAATPNGHAASTSSVPATLSHELQQQPTSHMSHSSNEARRFSMEKRPNEPAVSLDVSHHHEFPHHVGPPSGVPVPQSTANSFATSPMPSTSSFSMDEKRPKMENATSTTTAPPTPSTSTVEVRSAASSTAPPAHQPLDMMYSGDGRPTETGVPTQKHEN